jgi:hypothetical protein
MHDTDKLNGLSEEVSAPMFDENTVFHSYPTPDGKGITIYPYEVPEEPVPATQPLRSKNALSPYPFLFALWLLAIPFFVNLWTFTHPSVAHITIMSKEQHIEISPTILVPAHVYPSVNYIQSQTVATTGITHQQARQAIGYVTFYNSLTKPQIVQAGTQLVGADGQTVITNQEADIPAGDLSTNGQTTVSAHAMNYGTHGNIKAGDIFGDCCDGEGHIQVINSAFSGGQYERTYKSVSPKDIQNTSLSIASTVSKIIQSDLSSLTSSSETIISPVPCQHSIQSNFPVGAETDELTVTYHEACSPIGYSNLIVSDKATSLLKPHELTGYTRIGEINISTGSKSIMGSQVAIKVNIHEDMIFMYDGVEKTLQGKSEEQAQTILRREPAVQSVTINLGDMHRLPAMEHISLNVIYK